VGSLGGIGGGGVSELGWWIVPRGRTGGAVFTCFQPTAYGAATVTFATIDEMALKKKRQLVRTSVSPQ
jgi:hypothetical protein